MWISTNEIWHISKRFTFFDFKIILNLKMKKNMNRIAERFLDKSIIISLSCKLL